MPGFDGGRQFEAALKQGRLLGQEMLHWLPPGVKDGPGFGANDSIRRKLVFALEILYRAEGTAAKVAVEFAQIPLQRLEFALDLYYEGPDPDEKGHEGEDIR